MNMKKKTLFRLAAGIAVGAAAAAAIGKICGEIKSGLSEMEFDSPFGDNWVTVSRGSSETAKGLTYIKVMAECDSKEDVCKIVFLAGKDAEISGEWDGNTFFRLTVGNGKHRQHCDINFDEKEITAHYYPIKIEMK